MNILERFFIEGAVELLEEPQIKITVFFVKCP